MTFPVDADGKPQRRWVSMGDLPIGFETDRRIPGAKSEWFLSMQDASGSLLPKWEKIGLWGQR